MAVATLTCGRCGAKYAAHGRPNEDKDWAKEVGEAVINGDIYNPDDNEVKLTMCNCD